MKTLRQLCVLVTLTLILASYAVAGQMETPVAAPPPPPSSATADGQIETTVTGQIQTTSSETVDPVSEVALGLLQGVLLLL